jgi:type IV pilus assembly protein PilQ
MKRIIFLLAVAFLAYRGRAQEESGDGGGENNYPAPNPVEETAPESTGEPQAMPDQPPPPAGMTVPPLPRNMPSRRRFPGIKLGDQERELLDKHRENAARAKAKNAKADPKAAGKATTKADNNLLNVDYVEEPILDVLRAIATAFKLSVIPDKDLGDVKVTIHLENIPVIEGLDKLCRSSGLELIADGNVYRVRKTRETSFSIIDVRNKRMNLDVQNRSIKDFLREFVEKTKINIVPGQDLRGTVTGHLKDVEPIDGFKALMAANNYDVRLKNGVYLVENGDSSGSEMPNFRRGRRNPTFASGGNSDVDVHDGKVNLSLNNASLGDALREIAEQAGLNYTIIGDVSGNVNAQLKGITVDEALTALLQGTRYAYISRNGTLLIGDRNPNTPSGQALSGAELVYLKYIKAENLEKIMPKSVPADNIKVIKEQNAILITGTVDDINLVKTFLDKIDVPTPQVLLEVVVVEYNRGKDSEFGIAPGSTNYGSLNANAHGELDGVTQRFKQGGFEGFIGLLPQKFDLTLRALEAKNKAKVLAMPKVTTLNGNKAELRVSRTSYYQVNSYNIKDGFQNLDFRTIDDGITIEITPWVTKHGEVNVSINPSIKTAEQAPAGAPPPITNRAVITNVRLMDGETLALGGLINSKEDNRREFVPILGSIPVLGYLFSWRKSLTQTTELVIYVTPHILPPDDQGVNLEEEFEGLDRRSGFLENSDFIKSSKNKPEKEKDSGESTKPASGKPAAAPQPAAPAKTSAPTGSKAIPTPPPSGAAPTGPLEAKPGMITPGQRMKAVVDSTRAR